MVDLVKLGYPDSGLSEGDGSAAAESFSARPLMPMVKQMVGLMRRYEPDVVITYPPNGLSGHPDHIRTHEVVVAAHANVVANGARAGSPPLLHRDVGQPNRGSCRLESGPPSATTRGCRPMISASTTPRSPPSSTSPPSGRTRLAALAAHASQPDAALLLRLFEMADDIAKSAARLEEYVRAYPAARRHLQASSNGTSSPPRGCRCRRERRRRALEGPPMPRRRGCVRGWRPRPPGRRSRLVARVANSPR